MSNKYLKTDKEGWVKDPVTGAVLNTNKAERAAYEKKKKMAEMVSSNENRLNQMEKNLKEIHSLIHKLAERLNA